MIRKMTGRNIHVSIISLNDRIIYFLFLYFPIFPKYMWL